MTWSHAPCGYPAHTYNVDQAGCDYAQPFGRRRVGRTCASVHERTCKPPSPRSADAHTRQGRCQRQHPAPSDARVRARARAQFLKDAELRSRLAGAGGWAVRGRAARKGCSEGLSRCCKSLFVLVVVLGSFFRALARARPPNHARAPGVCPW